MSERLIEPADYTPEILASIARIKDRMRRTMVSFTDDDVRVFEYEGFIYILSNPVMGEEPLFDEFGQFEKMAPMHNLTLIYDKGEPIIKNNWYGRYLITNNEVKYVFTMEKPRLRILRPDLCDRIESKT